MVGMRNEALISMRFVRSKLRKREESSNAVDSHDTTTQPTQVVSTIEPVGFRQTPSSVWHFPPLPPQPNIFIYNASSQVSTQSQFFSLIIIITNISTLFDQSSTWIQHEALSYDNIFSRLLQAQVSAKSALHFVNEILRSWQTQNFKWNSLALSAVCTNFI